jgi:hypothetical protein
MVMHSFVKRTYAREGGLFIFMSKHNLPMGSKVRQRRQRWWRGAVEQRQGRVFIGKRRILEFTVSRNTINKKTWPKKSKYKKLL